MRPELGERVVRTDDLERTRDGARIAVAGMVVARQRPATANGIVFMLLEDEHGQVNLIVPSEIYERHRATVRAEPLILARGRYERVGENRNVLVSTLESLGPLARRVAKDDTVWESLPRPHSFGHR
jgi:error-prone DNA polymerase